MLPDYKPNLFYTPLRFRHLHLIVIQATMAGGAVTIDAPNSSPNTSIALGAAGQFTITFPKGQYFHPVSACTVLTEQLGSDGYCETFSASGGTATYEFATTPGTAATPADGTRLCFTLLLGKI